MANDSYKIWMIQKLSGLCLLEINLQEIPSGEEFDGNLLAGLLTSYYSFTKKALGEDIRFFETANFRFIFSIDEDFYIVLLVSSKTPKLIAEKILNLSRKALKKKLGTSAGADFTGDLSEFDEMKEDLEQILGLKGRERIKFIRKKRKNHDYKTSRKMAELEEKIKQIQEN